MSAIISPCAAYRYRLDRHIANTGEWAAVIMVNPSTADAETDDATIRKLRGFGERNGWVRVVVGNLFAYRSTDVRQLATAHDPIGPENDQHLDDIMTEADLIVFAWGPMSKLPKRLRTRWRAVYEMARYLGKPILSIGKPAKDGHPCHPLMLAYATELQPWSPAL